MAEHDRRQQDRPDERSLKPAPHVEYLRQDLDALASSGARAQTIADARRSLRSSYGLPRSIRAVLGKRPMHIDPWEISVAWAYGLSWRPLPVIQSYSAYTPQLDLLNARALSGPHAPAMILRRRGAVAGSIDSIDERFPGWESPAAMRAMLCNYRALRTTTRWQLLERTGPRCGAATLVGVVHATTDKWIPIPPPPPGSVLFARVAGLSVGGLETVRNLLYRARERTVAFDQDAWRIVPATVGDGLILRAAPGIDFPRPFGLAPDSGKLSFRIADLGPQPISVRFFVRVVR
jgi:hypothetical protein